MFIESSSFEVLTQSVGTVLLPSSVIFYAVHCCFAMSFVFYLLRGRKFIVLLLFTVPENGSVRNCGASSSAHADLDRIGNLVSNLLDEVNAMHACCC